MRVQAGTVTTIDPDHVDITGPGYHIRIVEIESVVFLITGLTDHSLSKLVIRPTSRNQVMLTEDAGRTKPIARPHRVLDAVALDVWMERWYHGLYDHWGTNEAHKIDLWEFIQDQYSDVWQEFEVYVQQCLLEGGRVR